MGIWRAPTPTSSPKTLPILLLLGVALASIVPVHASGCASSCQLTAQTNVPGSDATVWVRLDNATIYSLPHTFSFANDTVHTLQILNLTLTGPSGARYLWNEWTYQNLQWSNSSFMRTPVMLYNYTGSSSFTAQYAKQYQYTLTFNDASAHPLRPPPNSVTLQANTTTVTTSSYTGQWLSAGLWTITSVTWENYPAPPTTTTNLDLRTGPRAITVPVRAYNATVRVLDASNNPLSGAIILTNFVNATQRSFTTNMMGIVKYNLIPSGLYSVYVYYQSQDLGISTLDASITPIATITTSWTTPPPPPPPPPPPSTSQPSWAAGSTLTVSNLGSTSLTLTWSAATTGSTTSQYKVLKEGRAIATLPANTTSYTVTGLTAGNSYEFEVLAVDSSGSVSSNALFTTANTSFTMVNTPTQFSNETPYLYLAVAIVAVIAVTSTMFLWQRARRNRYARVQPWPTAPAQSL